MPQRKKPQARKAAPARKTTSSTSKSQVNTQRLAQAAKNANFVPRAKAPAKPAAKQAPASTFQGAILAKKQELRGTHVYVLSVPYEAQYLMRGLGAQYHPVLKVHIYEGLKLPAQLLPYRSEEYSLERWIEDDLNGKVTANVTPPKMKPRSHQITAVKKISSSAKTGWRGFVLADNVGLGKTAEAGWGAALAAKAKNFTPQNPAKVLIVSPKSVIPHWRNTLHSIGIENVRAVVINYDQAKKLLDSPASASNVKKTVTANRHTMLKGRPTIGWDIIIADESHKLKNESQRSIAFGNIARYQVTADKAPFVIWTSATVGQTPLELGYLAPLIGQMVGLPTLTTDQWGDWLIANHFNVKKSKAGNFSWIQVKPDMTQSEKEFVLKQQRKDIDRLSELIFGDNSPSIRRNPEDIAGWPSQTYMATPLELSQEGKRLYEEAWNEFRKYIGLHPRGKNPSGGLAATMRFRQKASLLSAISTAEFVNDLLDNGLQVAVSVEFMETIDVMRDYLLKKGWHVAEFSGRNTDTREQERLRFQRGEAQVILFSVLEGINLHANEMLISGDQATSAKRAMVVHDIRYSAIDMTQIIGRTTRDGELAMAYLMFTEGTIEAKILQVVLERVKNVKSLSGDDDGTLEVVQDLLDGLGR